MTTGMENILCFLGAPVQFPLVKSIGIGEEFVGVNKDKDTQLVSPFQTWWAGSIEMVKDVNGAKLLLRQIPKGNERTNKQKNRADAEVNRGQLIGSEMGASTQSMEERRNRPKFGKCKLSFVNERSTSSKKNFFVLNVGGRRWDRRRGVSLLVDGQWTRWRESVGRGGGVDRSFTTRVSAFAWKCVQNLPLIPSAKREQFSIRNKDQYLLLTMNWPNGRSW